jgi:hypothetical protein
MGFNVVFNDAPPLPPPPPPISKSRFRGVNWFRRSTKNLYKGVSGTKSNKWQAVVPYSKIYGYPKKYLGVFLRQEEAARAYDEEVIRRVRLPRKLNFPLA